MISTPKSLAAVAEISAQAARRQIDARLRKIPALDFWRIVARQYGRGLPQIMPEGNQD